MIAVRPGDAGDVGFMLALDALVPGRPRNRLWYEGAVLAGETIIATVDDRFAGFAVFHRRFFERDFLSLLVVEPLCRRQGVASKLVLAVEVRCKGGDLFTSTNRSNAVMLASLRRWGFSPTGRIDNIDPEDPELIFRKLL